MTFLARVVPAAVVAATVTTVFAQTPTPRPFSAYDAEAKALLGRMTLDEKVGQMTQAEQHQLVDINGRRDLLPGLDPLGRRLRPEDATAWQDWTDVYDRLQTQRAEDAPQDPDPLRRRRRARPQQRDRRDRASRTTSAWAPRGNPKLVEEIGVATAQEVRATGIQWTFAPCVAVVRDERWGRTYESFGEDPKLVASWARPPCAACRAPTSRTRSACSPAPSTSSATAAPPTARARVGIEGQPGKPHPLDQGDTQAHRSRAEAPAHARATSTTIAAGVGSIMPSYNSWNGERCSGSKRLLTDILKGELGSRAS